MYRTALQKDAKYGEAYYRLGLTELKHRPAHGGRQFVSPGGGASEAGDS